jgi:hypothetical protein
MAQNVNTFNQFIPLQQLGQPSIIVKNECYFSMIFLGGNYLSSGNFLQKIFGGRDDVALIAGLRLQPDGMLITNLEEPNVVLDKRSIKPGRNTNVPSMLNMLVKIPAYMNSIGFSFKVATTKRSDNFSVALDVLNDNKGTLDGLAPTVVGKVLGIGKVVKDMFDKIDAANNRDLIQLVVNDFIIPASSAINGANNLQEGYLVIFVKDESEDQDEKLEGDDFYSFDNGSGDELKLTEHDVVFVDTNELEEAQKETLEVKALKLDYDETNKMLTLNGKAVANTYLVFKFQKETTLGENLNANWSKKFSSAVSSLSNEFDKTAEKLKELQPKAIQLFNEATALLSEDTSFTPTEKAAIVTKYRGLIQEEIARFKN